MITYFMTQFFIFWEITTRGGTIHFTTSHSTHILVIREAEIFLSRFLKKKMKKNCEKLRKIAKVNFSSPPGLP